MAAPCGIVLQIPVRERHFPGWTDGERASDYSDGWGVARKADFVCNRIFQVGGVGETVGIGSALFIRQAGCAVRKQQSALRDGTGTHKRKEYDKRKAAHNFARKGSFLILFRNSSVILLYEKSGIAPDKVACSHLLIG